MAQLEYELTTIPQSIALNITPRGHPLKLLAYFSQTMSSSSRRTASTDLPDLLSLPVSIVQSSQVVFQTTSWTGKELLYIGSCWLSKLCSFRWKGPLEYNIYESVLSSPSVFCMSGLSNLDSFHDGWKVSVQLLLCRRLPPGHVQYSSQHSWVIAVKLFLYVF